MKFEEKAIEVRSCVSEQTVPACDCGRFQARVHPSLLPNGKGIVVARAVPF